jgi:pimeloyl-ACP methyl ester carboxylesterase
MTRPSSYKQEETRAERAPTITALVEINVGGSACNIEYAFVGNADLVAPLIVFLHEGLGSISMWRDFPAQLCQVMGARGLVYSRPGYGHSTPRSPGEKWDVDFMHVQAREVLPALLTAVVPDAKPWLLGHSDGGSIALICAALFPEKIAGVIAIAPHIFVEDISVASIAATRLAYETTDLRSKLARHHGNVDSAFYGWNDIWFSPEFRAWSIENLLPQITCPLLAIQGVDDEYGTMAQIDIIARDVAHSQRLKLNNCGHSPHREQTQAVISAVQAFVAMQIAEEHVRFQRKK